MTAKARYHILKTENVILEEFVGVFTYEKLIAAFTDIWQDPDYNSSCNGLSDFRESRLQMSADDLRKFVDFFLEHKKNGKSRIAIMLGGPMDTALAMYFAKRLGNIHNAESFSTLEAACIFLQLDSQNYELLEKQEFTSY